MNQVSTAGLDERITVPDHVRFRHIDDELVIVDLAGGEYFALNAIGAKMWQALAAGSTPSQIAVSIGRRLRHGARHRPQRLSEPRQRASRTGPSEEGGLREHGARASKSAARRDRDARSPPCCLGRAPNAVTTRRATDRRTDWLEALTVLRCCRSASRCPTARTQRFVSESIPSHSGETAGLACRDRSRCAALSSIERSCVGGAGRPNY